MAGPSANVSRDFWDIAKEYAYLKIQQGTPSFDAIKNFNSHNMWKHRREYARIVMGSTIKLVGNESTGLGIITQASSTSQNFAIGAQDGYVYGTYAGEIIPDYSGSSTFDYTSLNNYLFSGTVSSISTDQVYDTSKSFRTKHYLTGSGAAGCRLHMLTGAAAGNSYPITAFTSNSVTATGAGAAGVVATDTYKIIPGNLSSPSGSDRDDDVYLMMILDDIDEIEDTDLEDPTLSLTEAHGYKQHWCVRVDENQAGTFVYDDGYVDFLKVAELNRLNGNANVLTAMIQNDPDSIRCPPYGDAILDLMKASYYDKNTVTVIYDALPVGRADYQGATALYDAVNALKATNSTIIVYGGGGTFTWGTGLTITGELEIICVGGNVTVTNNVAVGFMCTVSTGSLTIRNAAQSPTTTMSFTVSAGTGDEAFTGPEMYFDCVDITGHVVAKDYCVFRKCEFTVASGSSTGALSVEGKHCRFEKIRLVTEETGPPALQIDTNTAIGYSIFDQLWIDAGQDAAESGRKVIDISGSSPSADPGRIYFKAVRIENLPQTNAYSANAIIDITGGINTFWDGVFVDVYTARDDLLQPIINIHDTAARTTQKFMNTRIVCVSTGPTKYPVPFAVTNNAGIVTVSFNTSANTQPPKVIFDDLEITKFTAEATTSAAFYIGGAYEGDLDIRNFKITEWRSTSATQMNFYGIDINNTAASGVQPQKIYIKDFLLDLYYAVNNGNTTVANDFNGLVFGAVDNAVELKIDGFIVRNVDNGQALTNVFAINKPDATGDPADGAMFSRIDSDGGMIYWSTDVGSGYGDYDQWNLIHVRNCDDGIGWERTSTGTGSAHITTLTNAHLHDNNGGGVTVQGECISTGFICTGISCRNSDATLGQLDIATPGGNRVAGYDAALI